MCRPILLWNTLFSPVASLFASSRNVQRTHFVIASTMSNIINIITYIHFSSPEIEKLISVCIELFWLKSSCYTGFFPNRAVTLDCWHALNKNPERTNSLNQSQGSKRPCHLFGAGSTLGS